MATVCDIAEEVFLIGDGVHLAVADVHTDPFLAGDGFDGIAFISVTGESFTISDDVLSNFVAAIASESFTIHSAIFSAFDHPTDVAQEQFRIHSAIAAYPSTLFSETFGISDDVVQSIAPDVLREVFRIHGAGFDGFIADLASEAFLVHSAISGQSQAIAQEAFTIHAVAVLSNLIVDLAREAFTVSDDVLVAQRLTDIGREAFSIRDLASQLAAIANSASEVFYIGDRALVDGELAGGWSASTDTFAMSRYALPRARAIGTLAGVLIVATEDGLFALTGDDDDGAPINAQLQSGLIDIGVPTTRDQGARDTGDPHQKRPTDVYIGYRGGRLQFGIGITPTGVEQRYWYPFALRTATDWTSGKAKLGRGARSRFWRFLLENIGGDDFAVKEQRVLMNPTKRRL